MSATHCIGEFERALRRLPTVTTGTIRALVNAQPRTCPNTDCTPGGCRKHCIEYATGAVERMRNARNTK